MVIQIRGEYLYRMSQQFFEALFTRKGSVGSLAPCKSRVQGRARNPEQSAMAEISEDDRPAYALKGKRKTRKAKKNQGQNAVDAKKERLKKAHLQIEKTARSLKHLIPQHYRIRARGHVVNRAMLAAKAYVEDLLDIPQLPSDHIGQDQLKRMFCHDIYKALKATIPPALTLAFDKNQSTHGYNLLMLKAIKFIEILTQPRAERLTDTTNEPVRETTIRQSEGLAEQSKEGVVRGESKQAVGAQHTYLHSDDRYDESDDEEWSGWDQEDGADEEE